MTSEELLEIFEVSKPISESIIEENSVPLFDLSEDVFLIIPSYMAWCLNHDHSDGNLILDGTISALSELGRAKYTRVGDARFKFECTEAQVEVVLEFLEWCLKTEPLISEWIERALKQWRKPIDKTEK